MQIYSIKLNLKNYQSHQNDGDDGADGGGTTLVPYEPHMMDDTTKSCLFKSIS